MKPLLAYTVEDTSKLHYPLLASVKLDGIRCLILKGETLARITNDIGAMFPPYVVVSRSLKPIRNAHVQKLFGIPELDGCDGELIVGKPNSDTVYRDTNSGVMSGDGEPDVTLFLFDRFDCPTKPFSERYASLPKGVPHTKVLSQHVVSCESVLLELEQKYLDEGYEGLMVRSSAGAYKFGRSTAKDGILGKLKRMASDEAEIIDMTELMRNGNEAKLNELGYSERSSNKENLIPGGVMGTLVVRSLSDGCKFEIGTGFTAQDRSEFWLKKGSLIGKVVSYTHFPVGRKDLPRHPSFKGFRDKEDM